MSSRRARTLLLVVCVLIALAVLLGLLGVQTVRRSFPQTAGTLRILGLEHPVEVFRDAMGVPSIYALTMHDLMMAQGFVQAQDRFWQMDASRHIGAGRLSEMFGEGQVETDLFLRTLGWERVAQQEWDVMDGDKRAYLEDYAEGVNAYLAQRSGSALSLEYAVLGLINSGYQTEPWTPIDTITWGKVMAWDLGGNMTTEISLSILDKELDPEVVALLYPPYPADHPIITEPSGAVAGMGSSPALPEGAWPLLSTVNARVHGLSSLLDADLEGIGSNNWVIAGSRTTTGGPLLANDMHLGIQMPSIWYEMGLHCQPVTDECPLDVVGFTFPGVPAVVVGHNASIAWGVTNGGPDVQDLYIEKVNPENPNQYEVNGQWVDMDLVEEIDRGGGRRLSPADRALHTPRPDHLRHLCATQGRGRAHGHSVPPADRPGTPGALRHRAALDGARTGEDHLVAPCPRSGDGLRDLPGSAVRLERAVAELRLRGPARQHRLPVHGAHSPPRLGRWQPAGAGLDR